MFSKEQIDYLRNYTCIASHSGGRDSTCMVLKLLELEYPLDAVICVDLGAEFECIYDVITRIKEFCELRGIPYYIIKPERDFNYYMCEKEVHKRDGTVQYGYKWCGRQVRWGTTLKLKTINDFYRKTYGKKKIVEYVGIAANEAGRIDKCGSHIKVYPLIEWQLNETDCLQYCYSKGITWRQEEGFLYEILKRVSCKWCRNKNLSELYQIYCKMPKYWQELKALESEFKIPYYGSIYLAELEERFLLKRMEERGVV